MKKKQIGHVFDYKEIINSEEKELIRRCGECYQISEKGVHLKRIQEVGLFNFGSTIVLIFSSEKPVEFKYKVGDQIKIGNQLYFK